jgi:hypothetical protein
VEGRLDVKRNHPSHLMLSGVTLHISCGEESLFTYALREESLFTYIFGVESLFTIVVERHHSFHFMGREVTLFTFDLGRNNSSHSM